MLLRDLADGRQLDAQDEVTSSLEADQLGIRKGGGRELGIVVELQRVVPGMEDRGRGSDRGDPLIRQRGLIVESRARRIVARPGSCDR